MAPQAANDQYTWIPPTPIGVQQEAGFVNQLIGTAAGEFSPAGYTLGWTCQTYLGLGTAGIAQTYSIEAPTAEEPAAEVAPEKPAPKPRSSSRVKNEKAEK